MQKFTDEAIAGLVSEIEKAMGKKDKSAANALTELHRENKRLDAENAQLVKTQATEEVLRFAGFYAHLRQPGNCIIQVKATQQEWSGVTSVAYSSPEQLDQTVALAIRRTQQSNGG